MLPSKKQAYNLSVNKGMEWQRGPLPSVGWCASYGFNLDQDRLGSVLYIQTTFWLDYYSTLYLKQLLKLV